MDIEKIKSYNQKMLAALSTIIVIAAAIGLIFIVVFIISEFMIDKRLDTNTLLSDEKVEELKKDSLRQQIISYDSPKLVDTLNLVYLIPVSVKTLDNPEEINEGVLGLLDGNFKTSSLKKYRGKSFYGSFSNLIVYDYNKKTSQKVSDYRLIGSDLSFNYFDDEIVVVFTGAEKDTNADKKVTLQDFKSLLVYSLKERQLRRIRLENSTVISFKYVEGKKDILITFGLDRNKNNQFETNIEPTFVMKYDYSLNKLITIIDKDLEKDIQRIIDKN